MNKAYIDAHDVVGRYLRHELTDEEYTAFHLYLLQHPDFKKEVEAERHAYRALRARTVTTQRHATMTSPFKPRTLILLAVLLLTGLWYFYRTNRSAAPFTIDPSEVRPLIIDTPRPTPALLDTPQERPTLPSRDERTHRTAESIASPIAAADFSPNPYLEPYLEASTRSAALALSVSLPDTVYRRAEGYVTFPLTYRWTSTVSLQGRILLFSNAPADYLDFRPLLAQAISLAEARAAQSGQQSLNVDVSPGLYYLLWEDAVSGEYWSVQRIVVLPE